MGRYTKSITLRLREDQYEFLMGIVRASGGKITISDVIRRMIDSFWVFSQVSLLDALKSPPLIVAEKMLEMNPSSGEVNYGRRRKARRIH